MKNIIISILLMICVISLNSCKKKVSGCTDPTATNYNSDANEDDGSCTYSPSLTIGQSYEGGVIGYILQSGDPGYNASEQHGIIAPTGDQTIGLQWYNGTYVATGASGTAIGTGNANTNAIVSSQGSGSYAAKLCADLVMNGYSDWYMPSKDELNKLYINKNAIGGFTEYAYWSSSESDNNNAWCQYFSNGNQFPNFKSYTYYVRVIRAF
ncbi:MAG: DUF1566 domain-containing protein [Bacteroidota bacterium]